MFHVKHRSVSPVGGVGLKSVGGSGDTVHMFRPRNRKSEPRALPRLVSWTNHYLVEDGVTWAQEAYVLFPGETAPRLTPVALDVRLVAA